MYTSRFIYGIYTIEKGHGLNGGSGVQSTPDLQSRILLGNMFIYSGL